MNVFSNKRLRVFLLLLVDLLTPLYIIWSDLHGAFVSVGAYGLFFLEIIGAGIHMYISFLLARIWYRFFTQEKSLGIMSAVALISILILLLTAFLIALPGYAVKSLAPAYDRYTENKGVSSLKQLESFYEEPTYLPPQVKFSNKRVEKGSWQGDYTRILVTYVCPEINKQTFGNVAVAVSASKQRYNLQNPETVKIAGKEAVFVGDQQLVLYDTDVTREVFRSGDCGVTKEDLIKIMESLQPAPFAPGTYQYYGPPYHSL